MNTVTVNGETVCKRFDSPVAFEHEWRFYRDYPSWTPRLVKLIPEELTIVMERGGPAHPTPGTIAELSQIIEDMQRHDIHHRDLHPGNIVHTPDGIRVIDWETATQQAGVSYDIHGPIDVPVPVQHGGLIPQWWDSNDPGSIKHKWGVPIPVRLR